MKDVHPGGLLKVHGPYLWVLFTSQFRQMCAWRLRVLHLYDIYKCIFLDENEWLKFHRSFFLGVQ